ncbi:MAG: hypothetical protein ACRCZW_04340 [Lactobacillaceae bacterium]
MANEKVHYSKEWQILKELAEGKGLQELEQTQLDATLNRKIYWFLFNGAGGILNMVKELYGDDGLKAFYEFLNYFISNSDTPGHYYHSDKASNDMKLISTVTQKLDFKQYLKNLKKELIENDERKGRN